MIIFTVLNCIVFCLISAIHIYWAFGGKWGMGNVIPKLEGKPVFQPGRISTLIVAAGAACSSVNLCWWQPKQ